MRVLNITKRSGRLQAINFLYILIYRENYEKNAVLKPNFVFIQSSNES